MRPGSFLAAVSAASAAVANTVNSLPVEKIAAAVGILAGLASFAVSIKNLLTKKTPANA